MKTIRLLVEFANTDGTGLSEEMINDLLKDGADEDSLIETDYVYFNVDSIIMFYSYRNGVVIKMLNGEQYIAKITIDELLEQLEDAVPVENR